MSAAWTISGQTGKRMDATARTLAACGITSPALRFASMAADSFSFTIPAAPPAGAAPEDGQTVSLFRDAVRVFTGTVTSAPIVFAGGRRTVYQITVSGGWWQLEQIALTSDQTDDTAATKERPVIGIASATMATGAKAILARARALGCPVADGTIDAGYVLPGMTFPNMTAAAALAEVLRWHPGAMTAMDYSGTGSPKINIRLRASAATVAVDVAAQTCTPSGGAAVACKVKGGSLTSKKAAQSGGVIVSYAGRDVTGKMQYLQQTAGVVSSGRRRVVAISGPELDTYLPRQEYETCTIKTTGTVQLTDDTIVRQNVLGTTWPSAYSSMQPDTFLPPAWSYADGRSGTPPHAWFLLPGYTVPDWAVKQLGLTVTEVVWSASLCSNVYYNPTLRDGVWYSMVNGKSTPMGIDEFIEGATLAGYDVNFSQSRWWWKRVTVRATVLSSQYAAATLVYRTGDFAYANPPATLAADMYAAGNFTGYQGQLQVVEADALGVPWMGRVVNLATTAGMPAEYATAKAMVAGLDVSIFDGVSTVRLGPPARHNFESLVSGIRRTPQDNIRWI